MTQRFVCPLFFFIHTTTKNFLFIFNDSNFRRQKQLSSFEIEY